MKLRQYIVLDKKVGETPLSCAEAWRVAQPPAYYHLPLAYAGRLDPMASGKLLVLIGEECKNQERYHALDKRYEFSVLLGTASDTGDVLGRLSGFGEDNQLDVSFADVQLILNSLIGSISLPFPHFSAKTVKGKPLHMWTLEGRLSEITVPTQTSTIYQLTCTKIEAKTRAQITAEALTKINSIPPVTDERKALGNDFRRTDIRADWERFRITGNPDDQFPIIHLACICSSGTYMRSLAEEFGRRLGNIPALAYHIHRTHIGKFKKLPLMCGLWTKKF
jgi:tRNA pseudouridine(55) synthase